MRIPEKASSGRIGGFTLVEAGMLFHNSQAKFFAESSSAPFPAQASHLAFGAHPDDVEFMAWSGILECFQNKDKHFASVVATSGGGSSRIGPYATFSDQEMEQIRAKELQKAALLGDYSFAINLGYTSAQVRGLEQSHLIEDFKEILSQVRPQVIYTHNLADRHDTHVAVALCLIAALRQLAPQYQPEKFLGCEVWRSLDWLSGQDRVTFNVEAHPSLSQSLTGLFDSQIAGGKRYDLSASGRRRANATYNDAYHADSAEMLELAMDLKPLLLDPQLKCEDFLANLIEHFRLDCLKRLEKVTKQIF